MVEKSSVTFDAFLDYFPIVDLPVTVSDEIKHEFSNRNTPFSLASITDYIIPYEGGEVDDLTEFVPCFRFDTDADFKAVVYWRAELLKHEYILATLDNNGNIISRKVIAGMRIDGDNVIQSVATIDVDYIIHIIVGSKQGHSDNYDPAVSQAMNMEILGDGEVIFSLNDE